KAKPFRFFRVDRGIRRDILGKRLVMYLQKLATKINELLPIRRLRVFCSCWFESRWAHHQLAESFQPLESRLYPFSVLPFRLTFRFDLRSDGLIARQQARS